MEKTRKNRKFHSYKTLQNLLWFDGLMMAVEVEERGMMLLEQQWSHELDEDLSRQTK